MCWPFRERKIKTYQLRRDQRNYYLERDILLWNLVPRFGGKKWGGGPFPERRKERCDAGYGVNATGNAVYLEFKRIERYGLEQAKIHGIPKCSKEKLLD